ncbi:MAG: 2-C-methyl-D-erythritol 2,4-cyclodiphosphate synthase [Gammaproteobacteria bacterium]
MRIGQGYDAHKFGEGTFIMLGGVRIPFEKGLAAHSDGDVLIHAICDALLGAAALGDIGNHFPDTDPDLKGVDSRILLRKVVELLTEKNHNIINVDATVVAQKPKISSFISEMKKVLASDLNLSIDEINIKGTTTEGMGFTGREEGIATYAVCLIDNKI